MQDILDNKSYQMFLVKKVISLKQSIQNWNKIGSLECTDVTDKDETIFLQLYRKITFNQKLIK